MESVSAQLKPILVVSEPERIEKLAAKKPRHGLDGKQKAWVCGVPLLLKVVEPAPGDDAMQVWMEQELSGPGVQYGGEAELSFEPALAELQKSSRGGAKQEVEHQLGIVSGEGFELLREGENDVEIVSRKDPLSSLLHPLRLG